jgi:hypothetical protein
MERRFLLTIGQPVCAAYGCESLERVSSDIFRVGRYFSDPHQGYEWVLQQELASGASSTAVRHHLSYWFSQPDRSPGDRVILYWAGHGAVSEATGDHLLLTPDSTGERDFSAVSTQELVRLVFGNPRITQSLLLILDVCNAAHGADDLLESMRGVHKYFRGGSGLWLMCTTDANANARDGAFVNGFLRVMSDSTWATPGGAEFVSPEDISCGVNEVFDAHGVQQRVRFHALNAGHRRAQFVRNPGFDGRRGPRILDDEIHWKLKASGTDAKGFPGWFFAGRHHALKTLLTWLHAPVSDSRPRIVTGAPGSGKSAVLGLLSVAADAAAPREMRDAALRNLGAGIEVRLLPLQLRGLRLEGALESLCRGLDTSPLSTRALLVRLSEQAAPIGILADSLDESAEPGRIERELLRPLAAHPQIRLVVGTRKSGNRTPMADLGHVIDLDDVAYFQPEDVTEYVWTRLTSASLGSPYTSHEQQLIARKLAEAISAAANRSFLYARVVSRWFISAPPEMQGRPAQLPRDLKEVFDQDLTRFPEADRRKVKDLLMPLSYARARGLPHKNIWAAAASRMAGDTYDGADVGWLIENAGYFLIQDVAHGETVYRLYHESFAEYLRQGRDAARDHRAITDGLVDSLPAAHSTLSRWASASDPYIVQYFATHASLGGVLTTFLGDPEFLLSMSPDALTSELLGLDEARSTRAVRIYRKATANIRASDRATAAAYLALAALHEGDTKIANALRRYRDESDWWPHWSDWESETIGFSVAKLNLPVSELVPFTDHACAAAVLCGHVDGSVTLVRLPSGEQVFHTKLVDAPTPSTDNRITSMSVASASDDMIYIVATTGRIWVLDGVGAPLATRALKDIQTIAYCPTHRAVAVALGLFTSSATIVLLSLPSLTDIAVRADAARASLYALACVEFRGQPALAAGSDSVHRGATTETQTLRIWSLPDLSPLYHSNDKVVPNVKYLTPYALKGGRQLLICCMFGRNIRLWDMDTDTYSILDQADWSYDTVNRVLAITETHDGATLLGEEHGRLKTLALSFDPELKQFGRKQGFFALPRVFESFRYAPSLHINGRLSITAAAREELYLLDVRELLSIAENSGKDGGATESLEVSKLVCHGSNILVGGRSGTLTLRTLEGEMLWHVGMSADPVGAIFMESQIYVLTADGHGQLLSRASGQPMGGTVALGIQAFGLTPLKLGNQTWAAVIVNVAEREGQSGQWRIRIVNPLTGEELRADRPISDSTLLRATDEEKRLCSVTSQEIDGRTLLAFAGPHGQVRYTYLDTLQTWPQDWYPGREDEYIESLATAIIGGELVMIAGGDSGRLYGYNLSTDSPLWSQTGRFLGNVGALQVVRTVGAGLFAMGTGDGTVRLMTFAGEELLQIDVGRPVKALDMASETLLVIGTDRGVATVELTLFQ